MSGDPVGVDLGDLPKDHPDRNRPLAGCWYRYAKAKKWHPIRKTWRIAGNTFNELGDAWTTYNVFRYDPPEDARAKDD